MAPGSVTPSVIAEYLITIFQTLSPIFWSQYSPFKYFSVEFPRGTCSCGSLILLPPTDSEEIIHVISRQKNKSTDLMNIFVFINKISAPLIFSTVSICSSITCCLKELFWTLRKPAVKKKVYYLPERKTFQTKDIYHAVLNIVRFETFSVKRKKNDLHRKYRRFGGRAENLSFPTISQIEQNWWLYFIYKALEQSATATVFKFFVK